MLHFVATLKKPHFKSILALLPLKTYNKNFARTIFTRFPTFMLLILNESLIFCHKLRKLRLLSPKTPYNFFLKKIIAFNFKSSCYYNLMQKIRKVLYIDFFIKVIKLSFWAIFFKKSHLTQFYIFMLL